MPNTLIQPSFARGELTPELHRRIDLATYAIGAETMKNVIVLPRGGWQSRTGTRFIEETKTSAKESRLIPFVYSTEQAYMLEFGDQYMRVYKDGGIVLDGSSNIYELATPYLEADIWKIKTEQSADVLYITCDGYAPRKITRTGHAAWTIAECDFLKGPLLTENATDTTLTLSITPSSDWAYEGNSVTVTASASLFAASDVGSIWGIRYISHAASYSFAIPASTNFTSSAYRVFGQWEMTINPNDTKKMDAANTYIEKSIDEGVTWFRYKTVAASTVVTATIYTGTEDVPCYLRVVHPDVTDDAGTVVLNVTGHEAWSCFKMTAFTSATVMTATMQSDFSKCGQAFKTWAEGDWGAENGFAAATSFFQNRLCFSKLNRLYMSSVDDYENFNRDIPQIASNAINERIPGRKVNDIKWLVPMKDLVVFTGDSEWSVSAGNDGLAFDSIKISQQSYWGCADVRPVVLGDVVVFLQRNGAKVRSIGYDYSVDGYNGNELSIASDHLFDGYTIVDWAFQQTPHGILWCVRSDGDLLGFTFNKEQQVWAWTHHTTDGDFESVATIPGVGQDDVYFIVKRTIGGATKRYVERLAHRDVSVKQNYFGVDCGLTYSGVAATTISGLSHLEGKTVDVLANGVRLTRTVASGAITVPSSTLVHVGLPFDYTFKSLSLDMNNSADKKKLINEVTVCMINSASGTIGQTTMRQLLADTATLEAKKDVKISITATWDKYGQFSIKGDGVLPMHVVAVLPRATLGGV